MRSGAVVNILMAAVVVWPFAALADDGEDPGRGVARISVVNGDVSVRRGDSGDWVAAAVNAPLVVEDTLATGPNSRAEVQFDYANMLRLSSNAEARFTELEHRRYQVQLARGLAEFSVLRDSDAEVDISTPTVSVRPSKRGRYRIHVMEDQTEITVRSGEVEVYTPTGVERVTSGRSILVRSGAAGPEFQAVNAMPRDEFDRWSEDRDRKLERTAGYRYVSPSIYGVEDLDAHGRWVYDPPYGWVWVPRVSPGWAPYSHGRWVWQDWYGWTWVGYEPWGWAPYHWGRWYHGHHGWCWYPGVVHRVHYWRPALVAFFGFGVGNVHVGFGFGRVGWVPLAPYEPYYPWYGRHIYHGYRRGFADRSIHITNVNIYNTYRNARVHRGVSGIDAHHFGRGRHNIVRVGDRDIRQAGLVRGRLPLAPDRASLRFADREVRHTPRATGRETRFFSRRQAAPVERVSFAEQRRAIQNEGRRSGPRLASAEGAQGGQGERTGWRRAGEPSRQRQTAAPAARETLRRNQPAERGGSGWRRLGEATPAQRRENLRQRDPAEPRNNLRGNDPGERGTNPRRLGDSTPAATGGGQTEPNRTWRRFGQPGEPDSPVSRSAGREATRNEERSGRSRTWQRFGQPGMARPSGPVRRTDSVERNRTERRSSAPSERSRQVAPRTDRRPATSQSVSNGRSNAGRSFSRAPSRSTPSRSMGRSSGSRSGGARVSRGGGGGSRTSGSRGGARGRSR